MVRTLTASSEPSAVREDVMKITITRDGNVFFRRGQIHPSDLPEVIRLAVKGGAERKVYLEVDARAKYRDVELVVDQVRAAGIREVCFLAEKAAK